VILTTLFLNYRGPLLIDWLPKCITVNANCYGAPLECLRCTIKIKRLGTLSHWFIISMTLPDCSLQEPSWEATALPVGSSSTSPLQSRPVPLWLSWKWHKISAYYWRRCTASNHIMTSLTATGLLQTWYRWTHETVGCVYKQPCGLCRIFWSICCVICTVTCLSNNPSACLSAVERPQPVFFDYSDMWYIHTYIHVYIHTYVIHTHTHTHTHCHQKLVSVCIIISI